MDIFSGDWEIDVDFISGSARHGACLNQDGPVISGRYRTQYGDHEIGGRADGEEIDMSVEIQFQGVGATYRFTGRARGEDRIEGVVDLGELLEGALGQAAGSEPQYRAAASTAHIPVRPGRKLMARS